MGESASDEGQDTNESLTDADLDQIARDAEQIASERNRGDEDTTDSLTALDLQQVQNRAFNTQGGLDNRYSDNDVTGFGQQNIQKDVSDFTTADQLQSMTNINNLAETGMFPNVPTPMGALINLISKQGYKNTINDINKGYAPTYNGDQITGTTGFGIGMGSPDGFVDGYEVFTNTSPSEMTLMNSNMNNNENGQSITTPTVTNPISGKEQCPDGYVFDNDLQACRLKTRADDAMGTPKNPPDMNAPAFTRNYSLLNTTPSNVPQGFDFNQANQNFMSRFAPRPSIFKQPPNLLGFTPFRSS